MIHRHRPLLRLAFAAAFLACLLGGTPAARAEGQALDGRLAPELEFATGMNGVGPGTKLSDFRGRVVWVKFWLRDCPHCRASLPRLQQVHEQWAGRGLVVLTVLHQYGPADAAGFMAQNGYTFPVGTDPDGSLARRYGVRVRPVDYLIGVDGRVKASNGVADPALMVELGKYRLQQLGRVPPELDGIRQAVWNLDLGGALRAATAAAAAPGASAEAKDLEPRVLALAREELQGLVAYAGTLERRRALPTAGEVFDRLVQQFQGTALAGEAEQARAAFRARNGR